MTKFEAKEKLREANNICKEHIKSKRNKQDETSYMQDNQCIEEDEIEMKNKERILKSLEKTIRRNSDFRHLSYDAGKVQKTDCVD